jgi:hypothetical protein
MALDDLARLEAMLASRGAGLPVAADADALAALERCRKCHHKKLCDKFLAVPAANAARSFCPNAHYVEVRRHLRLAFTAT